MKAERIYVVLHSSHADGPWSVVVDLGRPATYMSAGEAEERRHRAKADFPDHHYKVVGYSQTQVIPVDF